MSTEIQVIEQNAIELAFKKENGVQDLFDRMAEQARSIVPDISTKKGRDAIASQAYKVSKSKTAVDNHGKELVAGIKAQAAVIDRDRKAWRDQCDALRDEIRKPLDDWEQAEKDRVAKHESDIQKIKDFANPALLSEFNASRINDQIRMLDCYEICSLFEEFEQEAKIAKFETLEALRKALADREKYEAEQAELERLRIAEQQRIQQEHEARIAQEAAEKARIEAEQKAKAEIEKAEREKREAIEREEALKREAEQSLIREQQAKERAEARARQAEIDKQNAIEAERKRIEDEQFAKEEAARKAEEARQADQEHRKRICNAALQGLIALGLDDATGKAVLNAINKGLVPNVKIEF